MFDVYFSLFFFRILSKMFGGASVVQERVERNRENWQRMNDKIQQLQCVSNSMDIFNLDINIEEEEDTESWQTKDGSKVG